MAESREKGKTSRIDAAYFALRRAILEQALEPGTKLPEDTIGSGFDMSRTLAREVLTRLQSDGLVEIQRGHSAKVASPSLDEAKDIFRMRRCLEREVIDLIVERWTPAMRDGLTAHIKEEDAAAHGGKSSVCIRLAGEFHVKLADLTGNRLLAKFVDETVSRCSLILALYGRPHSSECAVSEHNELLAALEAGDVERASRLMDAHLRSVEDRAMVDTGANGKPDILEIIGAYAARGSKA